MQEIKKLYLEIKKYLKIMPWNYARAIFRARCRMTYLKSNYKGSHQKTNCSTCQSLEELHVLTGAQI